MCFFSSLLKPHTHTLHYTTLHYNTHQVLRRSQRWRGSLQHTAVLSSGLNALVCATVWVLKRTKHTPSINKKGLNPSVDWSDCLRHCNGQWTVLASWSESEFCRTRRPRYHKNQQCGNSSWLLKEVLGGWPDVFVPHGTTKKAFIVNLGSEMIREWVSSQRPSSFFVNFVAFPETSLPVSCLRAWWMQSQAFSWALINISKQSWVNIRYLQSLSHAREDTSAPVQLTSNQSGSSRRFNIVANSTRCNNAYKKHNYSWK